MGRATGECVPADVILRLPVMLAQDFTAWVTWGGRPFQFTSAVFADFETGFVVVLVEPGTMGGFPAGNGQSKKCVRTAGT